MTAPVVERIDPTVPGHLAMLPKTPGSVVLAAAALSARRRAWELGADGKWRDVWGGRRSAGQLRDVEILHVEPAPAAKREVAS